jgi:hypothetical protein
MIKQPWLKRSAILPVLLLAAAVIIFFNKMALTNLILARGDTLLYFYPYWQAAADALQAGHVPLWNPDLFMGAPFIANSQVGFFYPLNWPFWLLLPTPYAISGSILLHLLIAAVGTYLAGRRHLALGRPAALLAALRLGVDDGLVEVLTTVVAPRLSSSQLMGSRSSLVG